MQIIDVPHTFDTDSGHYIETFLISTKPAKGYPNEWRIDKETGHEKVKTFLNKDFSIIPNLLFRPLEQGGGGHVFGTKDKVISDYANNSHGKIVEIKGPIQYTSGPELLTDDYYYNAVVKLNDSRAASALLEHGANTWNPFSVSPHIFIDENGGGNDKDGWKSWEGAALALVIKGAYGNDAVVSKLCNGPHKACSMELAQRTGSGVLDKEYYINNELINEELTANLITSLVSRTASTNPLSIMGNDNPLPTVTAETTKVTEEVSTQNKQPEMPIVKDTVVLSAPKQEQVNISIEELNSLKETQKQFKEMQNEQRDQILESLFADAEGTTGVELKQKYKKLDLGTVKQFKAFHDEISPLISARTKKAIEMELQKDKKETKVNSNGRAASVGITLREEPKVVEEQSRAASTTKIDEVGLLQKFLKGVSNN